MSFPIEVGPRNKKEHGSRVLIDVASLDLADLVIRICDRQRIVGALRGGNAKAAVTIHLEGTRETRLTDRAWRLRPKGDTVELYRAVVKRSVVYTSVGKRD